MADCTEAAAGVPAGPAEPAATQDKSIGEDEGDDELAAFMAEVQQKVADGSCEAPDRRGITLLMPASAMGAADAVELLLRAGANCLRKGPCVQPRWPGSRGARGTPEPWQPCCALEPTPRSATCRESRRCTPPPSSAAPPSCASCWRRARLWMPRTWLGSHRCTRCGAGKGREVLRRRAAAGCTLPARLPQQLTPCPALCPAGGAVWARGGGAATAGRRC